MCIRDRLAAEKMRERAVDRDVEQERSMGKIVAIFNIARGTGLSETDGWVFMDILKMVRGNTGPVSYTHLDVYKRQGCSSVPKSKKVLSKNN